MAVSPQEVLNPSATVLPAAVNAALVDLGNACNDAAVTVHFATGRLQQEAATKLAHESTRHAGPFVQRAAQQRQQMVAQALDQAIIAMSCIAVVYAVYASRVASAMLAGQDPPLPEFVLLRQATDGGSRPPSGNGDSAAGSSLLDAELVRPSDVMNRFDHYLPELRFTNAADADVRRQQDSIADLHRTLISLIIYRLRDEHHAYDDVTAVAFDDFLLRRCDFPDALHRYATALVVALGMFSVADGGK